MARRPLADQLPALLGGRDETARDRRPGGRRALSVSRRRPPRASSRASTSSPSWWKTPSSCPRPTRSTTGSATAILPSGHCLPRREASSSHARRSRRAWSCSLAATTPGTTRTASRRRATPATPARSSATCGASCWGRFSTWPTPTQRSCTSRRRPTWVAAPLVEWQSRLAARRIGSDRLRVGSSGRRERRSGQEETHGRS